MRDLIKIYSERIKELETVVGGRLLGLFIFNVVLMSLILMRSAGYFAPFFPISINFIVLVSIVLSVSLLGIRSRGIFLLSLSFWGFAALLKLFNINVWAERTAIYAYEAIVVGVILYLFENSKLSKSNRPKIEDRK